VLTHTPRHLHYVREQLIHDLIMICLQVDKGRQLRRSQAGLFRWGHRPVLATAQPTVARTPACKSAGPREGVDADRQRHLHVVAVAGGEDGGDSAACGEDARRRGCGAARRAVACARVAVAAERAARRRRGAETCAARPRRSSRIVAALRCADNGGGCASSDGDAGTLALDAEVGVAR
jgi:hypothetical protein